MHLSTEELALITALHDVQSLESICAESTLNDFEVCQVLWAFRVIGAIDRVDEERAAAPPPDDDGLDFVLAEE
jgi:hypothetical protein